MGTNVDNVSVSLMRYSDEPVANYPLENLVMRVVKRTGLSGGAQFDSHGASIGVTARDNATKDVGITFAAFPNMQCIVNGLPECLSYNTNFNLTDPVEGMVNSIVIGSSVYKEFQPVKENLKVSVVLNHLWTLDKNKNMSDPTCVYWDLDASARSDEG